MNVLLIANPVSGGGKTAHALMAAPRHSSGRVGLAMAVLMGLLLSKNAYTAAFTSYYTFYLIERFGVSVQASQIMLFLYLAVGARCEDRELAAEAERAGALLGLINPVNRARDAVGVATYKVEPYVMAADVYGVAPHIGRGGWTWYTGSAGWMYRAGLESILGLRRAGTTFEMDPCIPASWEGYSITWRFGRTRYEIAVANPERRCRGVAEATLDGAPVDPGAIPLADDGATHVVRLVLGAHKRTPTPMARDGAPAPA